MCGSKYGERETEGETELKRMCCLSLSSKSDEPGTQRGDQLYSRYKPR